MIRFFPASTNGWTAPNSNSGFVDEKFEVIPVSAQIKQPQSADGEDKALLSESGSPISANVPDDYTEDDLMFITESVTSLPSIFFPKVPLRKKEQLTPFNHQFYRYCKKKGINPFEYFFDEFGLFMAGMGLAGGIWRDYKEHYSKNGKELTREDKKLSSDFDHEQQIAASKEKDIQEGRIKTS